MTPTIIGESVQGDSHIRHGVERQDSYLIVDGIHKNPREKERDYYGKLPPDVKIIAVADGHGSTACPHSKTGSQTAANVFCDLMAEFAVKYKDNMETLFASLNREGESTRIAKSILTDWEKRILQVHAMNHRDITRDEEGKVDAKAIWKQYGSTLLGMLITEKFVFALQLGDGDILRVDRHGITPVIEGDKILGVETHSISKPTAWKKVLTAAVQLENMTKYPFMFVLSTDGWINSHASQKDFEKTCVDYLSMIEEHGAYIVEKNLANWLSETSALGCGDDITTVFAYFDGK